MTLVGRLLAGSEWSELFDLASPRLFKVLPVSELAGQMAQLTRNVASSKRARSALEIRRALLVDSGLPIQVVDRAVEESAVAGIAVLKLYFHQLKVRGPILMDLRARQFAADGGMIIWAPGRLHVEWPDDFVEPVWQMYVGFYQNDDTLFREALRSLGLADSESLFRTHFGDDPSSVRFELAQFRESFQQIFLRARDAGQSLHPSFMTFGVYLLTLYEHLESLGGAFNVAAAFEAVP